MNLVKKYPIISIALSIISVLIIQSAIAEKSLISGAMIQLGWCKQGDDICLFKHYFYISIAILLLSVVIQFVETRTVHGFNVKKRLSAKYDGMETTYDEIYIENDSNDDWTNCTIDLKEIKGMDIESQPLYWDKDSELLSIDIQSKRGNYFRIMQIVKMVRDAGVDVTEIVGTYNLELLFHLRIDGKTKIIPIYVVLDRKPNYTNILKCYT